MEAPVERARVDARRQAIEELARDCAARGFHIACDLVGNSAEAEELVQEALARACSSYRRLRDRGALRTWFYRVLTNLSLKVKRRRRADGTHAALWQGDRIDSGRAIRFAPDVARLLAAVGELPGKQRAAVVLRYGHDMSVEEVAAVLGVGRGTVKTHLVRGLHALRAALEESHE